MWDSCILLCSSETFFFINTCLHHCTLGAVQIKIASEILNRFNQDQWQPKTYTLSKIRESDYFKFNWTTYFFLSCNHEQAGITIKLWWALWNMSQMCRETGKSLSFPSVLSAGLLHFIHNIFDFEELCCKTCYVHNHVLLITLLNKLLDFILRSTGKII